MSLKVKCFICGTEFVGAMYEDACPICDWLYTGEETKTNPDAICDLNKVSINQAKTNFEHGLNIWGEPIKK